MIRSTLQASHCARRASTLSFRCLTTTTPPDTPDNNGVVFPWRSSPILLDRLQNPNDLSGVTSQTWWNRNARHALVARQLNYSWAATVFGTWKNELSEDMAWAFGKTLSGLLSHVLKVPVDVIDKDDDLISVDTSTMETATTPDAWTEEASQEAKTYLEQVLEEKLRSQYTEIDTATFDFKMNVAPLSCKLEHAFVIPVISRDAIAKDSSLLDMYHDLDEMIIQNASSYDEVKERVETLIEKSGGSRQTFTLIVDTSIECLEQFSISNKSTGALVQGSEQEQVVIHLVRFEMLLTEKDKLASWRVVDWDDMLGGNVWHIRQNSEADEGEKEGTERDEPSP